MEIYCSIKIGSCPTESGCFLLPDFHYTAHAGYFINLPLKIFKSHFHQPVFSGYYLRHFYFSVLGVSGSLTTVDALSGIKNAMGAKVMVGSIIGFLVCVHFLHCFGGGYEEHVQI